MATPTAGFALEDTETEEDAEAADGEPAKNANARAAANTGGRRARDSGPAA
jgi:hypothetical protein